MAGLGVLNGMFVIFSSTKNLDYLYSFSIAAGICLIISVILLFIIKDVDYEKKSEIHLTVKY